MLQTFITLSTLEPARPVRSGIAIVYATCVVLLYTDATS